MTVTQNNGSLKPAIVTFLVVLGVGSVVLAGIAALKSARKADELRVSLADYQQLKTGMTLEEVSDALGREHDGESESEINHPLLRTKITAKTFSWTNGDGGELECAFHEGKLAMKSHKKLKP